MKIEFEQKRLGAVKRKFSFFERRCSKCGAFIKREKMWEVNRWGINHTKHKWCYCTKCMPTANAVLHEIDTDDVGFGIYGVDEETTSFKKDTTRLRRRFENVFGAVNGK